MFLSVYECPRSLPQQFGGGRTSSQSQVMEPNGHGDRSEAKNHTRRLQYNRGTMPSMPQNRAGSGTVALLVLGISAGNGVPAENNPGKAQKSMFPSTSTVLRTVSPYRASPRQFGECRQTVEEHRAQTGGKPDTSDVISFANFRRCTSAGGVCQSLSKASPKPRHWFLSL